MSEENRCELSHILCAELEAQLGRSVPDFPAPPPDVMPKKPRTREEEIRTAKEQEGREEAARRRHAIAFIQQLAPERSALCLSGGGIRSASFSLGILQALAQAGLLKQFDFRWFPPIRRNGRSSRFCKTGAFSPSSAQRKRPP